VGLADADGAISVGAVGQRRCFDDIAGLGRVNVLAAANVQKGSDPIWTLADELARLSNVQIGSDPFWTLVV